MKDFSYRNNFLFIFGIVCVLKQVSGDFKLTIVHNNDVHAHFDEINVHSGECKDEQARNNDCYGGEARRNAFIKGDLINVKRCT